MINEIHEGKKGIVMEQPAIHRLADLDERYLDQAVRVFVEGFYEPLRFFSDDKTLLVEAMKHSFVKERFFAAVDGDRVLGILAYSDNRGRAHRLSRSALIRAFGPVKGRLAYLLMGREFQKPLELKDDNQVYIESVATAPEARGRGVATALLNDLFARLPFDAYILEVADTNTAAVRLYRKLGITVFRTKKQRWLRKRVGFNERLYMIRSAR